MNKSREEELNRLKDLVPLKDLSSSDVESETVRFCIRDSIEKTARFDLERGSIVVFTVLGSVLGREDLLNSFCDKLLELPIVDVYVSEYCFPVLWALLKKGMKILPEESSIVEMEEENWPAVYKMIRVSKS